MVGRGSEYVSVGWSVRLSSEGSREYQHDLLSPGARTRSTANMAGWTSKVGRGVSGSTNSISSTWNPRPTCKSPPFDDIFAGDDALGESIEDISDGDRALWPGDQTAGDDEDGESRDMMFDVIEDPRECVRLMRELVLEVKLVRDADGSSEEEISMLPPPTTCFRVSAPRTAFNACACARLSPKPRSSRVRVPTSCAYE